MSFKMQLMHLIIDWKPAKKYIEKKRTLGNMQENSSGVIQTNCTELWVLKIQLMHLNVWLKTSEKNM